MWVYMEAFGFWMNYGDVSGWVMLDDAERVGKTVTLLGFALLATVHQMEMVGLLADNGKAMRSFQLVLSLWFGGLVEHTGDARICCSWNGAKTWPSQVIAYANKFDVPIEGMYDVQKTVVKFNKAPKKDTDLVNKAALAQDADGEFGF